MRRAVAGGAGALALASAAALPARATAVSPDAYAPASICRGLGIDTWTAWLSNDARRLEVEFFNCSGVGDDKIKITVNNASDPPAFWFHGSSTGSYHVGYWFTWEYGPNHVQASRVAHWSDGGNLALRWSAAPGGGGGGGPWIQARTPAGEPLTVTDEHGHSHPLLLAP